MREFICKHCLSQDWNPICIDEQFIANIICEFYICTNCKGITMVYQSSGLQILPVFSNGDGTYSFKQDVSEHLQKRIDLT